MTKRKQSRRARPVETAAAPSKRVGVIMVVYNRSDVTNLALDSISRARNQHASCKVFLVDNASRPAEFERIERLFQYLLNQGRIDGEFIKNASNLGYAAGNNQGIRSALNDPALTHLCLLNNDVIVTDGWLDRLVEQADATGGLVGPVSNSVGNDQIIPVPYPNHGINGYSRQAVSQFAAEWTPAHRGNIVRTQMLGFFCVLGPRRLFETVGLLDEQFGLGYFEDDDYCLRCVQAGFPLTIVREVFIHHWGSASFSAMERPEQDQLFQKNRQLFQNKHGTVWYAAVQNRWQHSLPYELSWLSSQGAAPDQLLAVIRQWAPQLGILRANDTQEPPQVVYVHVQPEPPPFVPLRVRLMDDIIDAVRLVSPRMSSLLPPLRELVEKSKRMPEPKADPAQTLAGESEPPKDKSDWQRRRRPRAQTVIVLPIQGYDGRRQRPQHLADGLARQGFEVFWIDPKLGPQAETGATPQPEVTELPSGVFQVQLVGLDPANFYTSGLASSEVAPLLSQLAGLLQPGVPLEEASLLVQSPFWTALAQAFPGRVIYDCMDFHAGFGSATMEVELLESELLAAAHEVVVSSDYLFQTVGQHDPDLQAKLHIIRNGCAPADFLRQGRSLQPEAASSPVVGYFGAVAEWFDHELLIGAAQALPEVKFEIIGDHHYSALGKLELPANIELLGEQPYEKLPELVTSWRAALIPFCITELILATNPVKLYEYSALGMPVVATPIPEVMQAGLEVFIGRDSAEFAAAIRTAMEGDTDAKLAERRRFAERNSWTARVDQLARLMQRQA